MGQEEKQRKKGKEKKKKKKKKERKDVFFGTDLLFFSPLSSLLFRFGNREAKKGWEKSSS